MQSAPQQSAHGRAIAAEPQFYQGWLAPRVAAAVAAAEESAAARAREAAAVRRRSSRDSVPIAMWL